MARTCAASVLFLPLWIVPAGACPDFNLLGMEIQASAADLSHAYSFPVTAGGEHDLSRCQIIGADRVGVYGFAARRPDFSLRYHRQPGFQLQYSVYGDCDTVLLVNDGAAVWHFADDRDGTVHPSIRLDAPAEGWHDIWIGTFEPATCPAVLTIGTLAAG
jgi:hypothetical protein